MNIGRATYPQMEGERESEMGIVVWRLRKACVGTLYKGYWRREGCVCRK